MAPRKFQIPADVTWEPLKDDDNPPRFYEPLPSGPYKGMLTDRERVSLRIQAYFETLGWDDRGITKKETLDGLGLSDVDSLMERFRQ